MANNQLLASDNFASGSLAVGWSNYPTLLKCQVVAGSPNVTEPNVLSTAAGQIWTGLSWPNDQICEVTLGSGFVSESTTTIVIAVRNSTSADSGYHVNLSNVAGITLQVFKLAAGVATQIGSNVSLTVAAGDIWAFQAAGGMLTVYQNFNRVFYMEDTTYTSGSPGFQCFTTSNLAHAVVSSWRGYSAVQQDGVWQKQGITIPGIASDFAATNGIGVADNSIVLFEGNPQLLSGSVYKTWFEGHGPAAQSVHQGDIFYAESLDGINWIRSASPVISANITPAVIKVGSTYYLYCQPNTGPGTATWALYTSTNGTTWTQQSSTILSLGTSGQWDDDHIWAFNPVAIINGTWYALYSGGRATSTFYSNMGLATSPDGIVWTKSASNPVLTNAYFGQAIVQVGNTWYQWVQACQLGRGGNFPQADPGESVRWQTTDFIHWTNPVHSVHCQQFYEGLSSTTGQSYFNSIINVGGKAYVYTTSGNDTGPGPINYQIGLAIAPAPIASVVTQNEDAVQPVTSDSFVSGIGNLSASWTKPTGGTALQIVSGNLVEPTVLSTTCSAIYTGTSFNNNHYSEITLATLAASAFVTPLVRGITSAQTWYEVSLGGPTNSAYTNTQIFRTIGGAGTAIGPKVQITPQVGDVYRLAVITGSDGFPTLSFYQNGFLILQVQDQSASALTTGAPGMKAYATTALTNSQISLWAGGNANVLPNFPPSGGSWLQANRDFANKRGVRGN